MKELEDCFPPGLNDEEKAALEWKAEKDFARSNLSTDSFRDEYFTFAINFYTRNFGSLEDVVVQYRAHKTAARRQQLAQAFMADMMSQIREQEAVMALSD